MRKNMNAIFFKSVKNKFVLECVCVNEFKTLSEQYNNNNITI